MNDNIINHLNSEMLSSDFSSDNFKNDVSIEQDNNIDNDNVSTNNEVIHESTSSTDSQSCVSSFDDYSNINTDYPLVLNYDEIMKVRVNNTLALADKKLLNDELLKFDLLKDYTFDQEIGYLVCSLLDSKLRVVSNDNMIISYDSDANVKQNLLVLDKMIDVYNKITNSHKNIAIISDDEWSSIKNEYISNIKNGVSYEIQEEPEVIFEESTKNDIIGNSAIDLFGDIVEIE